MPDPISLSLILAAIVKVGVPFAAKGVLSTWLSTQTAGLFAYLSAHGLAVTAATQTAIISGAAAILYAVKYEGADEYEAVEAGMKAGLTKAGSQRVWEYIQDHL